MAAKDAPEIAAHKEWIGQIQQAGLVVSPHVLARHGVIIDRQASLDVQARVGRTFRSGADPGEARFDDFLFFTRDILDWPADLLAGAPGGQALPDALTVALPEHDDVLVPTYAVPDPEPREGAPWLALIQVVDAGTNLDALPPADQKHVGWRATPQARLERLMRETQVPIGILFNGDSIRLVHAPRGESSGHLTFRFSELVQTMGRPMAGALQALLGSVRVLDVLPEAQRLPALLRESRKYQNEVSTKLAGQVLEALWELVRGFDRANQESEGVLLTTALREAPEEVYGGLLSTLMRLVFVLYAEDRGLMPQADVYQKHYAVSGLFNRLREDAARHPDTMDARYGAWAQLLALFRLIHDGGAHGDLRFPARHGRLFNPDAYPFLEGRPHGTARTLGEPLVPPRISDGVVFRVLTNLLMLEGERLSYRTLDVEQIGSVYEAMMGFALKQAAGPSVAVAPKHIVINLEELIGQKADKRAEWLKKQADLKLNGTALAKAATVEDALAALGKRVSRYTPHRLPVGALYLQPTEERRRSGSHYTPRALTAPIVSTTLRPIFERLGADATADQILDLKVCDPAMGSGAFLVEACRLLADRLVRSWERHRNVPAGIPADEDVLTYAMRLVAERCLYGVDKNIFAVDLAKLSLWLATLAREHPFTFLDHALRHGDSLVGLSREQIACFNWETTEQLPRLRGLIDARVAEAERLRDQIRGMAASDDVPEKSRLLREAEDALADVRSIGDLVIAAFFERGKAKERQALRVAYAGQVENALSSGSPLPGPEGGRTTFHWEAEFPEVFTRDNAGFDAFVGNPPFAGKNTISAASGEGYLPWLLELHESSHGNADLVAHFYRRAFNLLRKGGTFGLIATNTISQGDTRGTGLRWIRRNGGVIFTARKRIKWPGEAAVVVSVVHTHKGPLEAPFDLDGRAAERITAFLFHAGGDEDPKPLPVNSGKSFQGSIVLGMGFTFDDTDKKGIANPTSLMRQLIQKDESNAVLIRPFIGYAEVAEEPTHSFHRFVIDFGDRGLDEAKHWPDLLALVEERVKPAREANSANQLAKKRASIWWQFGSPAKELYKAVEGLPRVLVNSSQAAAHLAFAFLPNGYVYSSNLNVFPLTRDGQFAVLQSRPHEVWARFFGATIEDRLSYTPTDCFETFPFPDSWESSAALEKAGTDYYTFRAELMVRNNQGLTETYNRFHDRYELHADIVKLRALHDAMDRAVLAAYGWNDLQPTCDFILEYEDDDAPGEASTKKKPYRYRWPDDVRDEVLARLLALNVERVKATAPAQSAAAKPRKPGKSKKLSSAGPLLD